MSRPVHCCMCGFRLPRQGGPCKCPWRTPFDRWPRLLLNTLRSKVVGGPYEK